MVDAIILGVINCKFDSCLPQKIYIIDDLIIIREDFLKSFLIEISLKIYKEIYKKKEE